jgi:RimJ/RimL family protein N-acetyltransferase
MRPWELPPDHAAGRVAARLSAGVPEITTERFRLRAPSIGDFPIYARFLLDDSAPDAAGEAARKEAWLDFCQLVAGWMLRGYGPWTVEPRDGGEALGAVVLNHEYGDPEAEIGWVVALGAEGRGIATEAARAARAHAFGVLGMRTLVSYVDPGNGRSAAVARRLGARRDPAAEAALGHEVLVFRHFPETAA